MFEKNMKVAYLLDFYADALDQLFFFEERFGLAKRFDELSSAVDILLGVYDRLKSTCPDSIEASNVKKAIEIISKGNQDVRESD